MFGVPLVVAMSDDANNDRAAFEEKAKDIIACGFDPTKTFLFSNSDLKE